MRQREIRPATEQDLPRALRLAWEVFLGFEAPGYGKEGTESFRRYLKEPPEAYRNGEKRAWVCLEDGEIVGMTALRGGNHVALLFVKKAYQRSGVGRELLEAAARWCARAGYGGVTVNAAPPARAFYLKQGFRDAGGWGESGGIRYMQMARFASQGENPSERRGGVRYASRMAYLRASEIREILKVTENPEIISFAGGLPAPELFPVGKVREAACAALDHGGAKALQYTVTEGLPALRAWVASRMSERLGAPFEPEGVLITHGSQQALDLTGKVFLDEGDVVLCESPTYLAALSAFRAYGCRFRGIPTDGEGMVPSELERVLRGEPRAKLIYIIPDFQNPTGRTWSSARRRALAELADRYQVMVLEDNPYGELRFEGEPVPSARSFGRADLTLCCGTFSKILCPGYRIGWIAGEKSIIQKYALAKQGADLQCNTLAQAELLELLQRFDLDAHIARIRGVYRKRRDCMLRRMEERFPKDVLFTRPLGGLFAWVELPRGRDASALLQECLADGVAFVPGGAFFPEGGGENTLRLNYSNMPEDRIQKGIDILASRLRAGA